MPTLQRRQSPLQNSPYCLVSEFEGEQPEGEESRPNPTLGNRRCPLPFSQTTGLLPMNGAFHGIEKTRVIKAYNISVYGIDFSSD